MMKPLLIAIYCLLFFFCPAFSQSMQEDAAVNAQVKNVINLYDQFTDGNATFYNGRQYIPYNFKSEGNAYLAPATLASGWIGYDGRVYESLPMLYDIVRNQVLVLNYNHLSYVILKNNKLDSFSLYHHKFIKLQQNDKLNLPVTGFYDLLYNGPTRLLARRTKEFQAQINGDVLVRIFYEHNHFYIFKGGQYHLVSRKKDVYRLFAEKKHDIKKLMRRQKIKFRKKNFEAALPKVAAFYDQVTR